VIDETLVARSRPIVLRFFRNSPPAAHICAPAAANRDYRSRMQSHRNPAAWIVFGIALFGAAAVARAQVEPAESIDTARSIDTAIRTLDLGDLTREGEGRLVSERTDSRHEGLFMALNSAFIISASTDVSISMYQIGRGVARETGFGAQWQDSPMAFAVTKSAMAAAFAYGLNRIHKTRPKTAFVIGIAATALEGWLAVRSARMSAPHP
jgi:hypothetical protein